MTFLGDRKRNAAGNRRQVCPVVSTEERGRLLHAAQEGRRGLNVFTSAAALAFESLDRESQISAVLDCGDRSTLLNLPVWKIHVPPEIADRVETWSFPLFSRAQVVRAALLKFIDLPATDRKEWIHEVFVFTGDPRQDPARNQHKDDTV